MQATQVNHDRQAEELGEAGIDVPADWDEFVATPSALEAAGKGLGILAAGNVLPSAEPAISSETEQHMRALICRPFSSPRTARRQHRAQSIAARTQI